MTVTKPGHLLCPGRLRTGAGIRPASGSGPGRLPTRGGIRPTLGAATPQDWVSGVAVTVGWVRQALKLPSFGQVNSPPSGLECGGATLRS